PQSDLRRSTAHPRRRGARRDRRSPGRLRLRSDLPPSRRPRLEPLRALGTGPLLVISFRYHLVSIIAVFLAMALGIVVGTTALNGPITTDLRKQVNSLKGDRTNLANQVKVLQNQADDSSAFADAFGAQIVTNALSK